MKRTIALAALALTSTLALAACADDTASDAPETTTTTSETATEPSEETDTDDQPMSHGDMDAEGHDHPADGGPPPAGIDEAENPTHLVGTEVVLTADHMPGMDGATATISGAFDTATYSVSYTPTDGGGPVTDHRWVVHEELVDPGLAPLPDGTEVVLDAEHMPGMQGAEATIDYSTEETAYMVDLTVDGMTMTHHKWVTESEIQPAQ